MKAEDIIAYRARYGEAGMMLHDLALYAIVLPAALAAWGVWRFCSKPVRVTLAGCALYLAVLLFAVDVPDPRGEITEAHRGLHRGAQSIAWMEPAQAVNADLTGFYLGLSRPGAGIREGAPAVSRPRFQGDRRFDTPAPRVRDTGTPAPGLSL